MPEESADLVVRITRAVRAPRAQVFSVFTTADELARWFGPKGITATVELDPRVGSRYRIEMQPADGDAFWIVGEIRELDRPERLVYTFRYEDPDPDDRENLVVVTFTDRGDATEVVVQHGPFATEARRSLHEQGWTDSLDRLEEVFAHQHP
jgi:uncharacterized protein YndB with AHSA1/START domain